MFAHAHLLNLHVNMWLIMWECSRNVEAMLLAVSVSFLSPAMLNPSRNSDRNKTSTRYKAIIQFWRPIKVRATLIKIHVNLRIFVCFWFCFATFVPALIRTYTCTCTSEFLIRFEVHEHDMYGSNWVNNGQCVCHWEYMYMYIFSQLTKS